MSKKQKGEVEIIEARGRPTKFTEALEAKILELARKGKTGTQIAKIIGVHERTLRVWYHTKDGFLPALKEARDIADELVEAALFSRAVGYTREIKKETVYYGKVIAWTETMHVPPDTLAAIFWLKNRQPEQWREKSSGGDKPPGPQDPDEIVVEFQDETPNKDAK